MDNNLWSRRTNSGKLSLSTGPGQGGADSNNTSSNTGRNGPFPKRFGGDSSSHGKSNPFNSITTPGGLSSPTAGASNAFGLGSGAFASFGSAKTPKSPGNPFEAALGGAAKTPSTEKSAAAAALGKDGANKAIGKPASTASLQSAESKSGAGSTTTVGSSASSAVKGAAVTAAASVTAHPHALRDGWVFWFRPPISKANGYIEYEKTLHPIAGCDTAEEFFAVYQHLKRPSALPLVSDYHVFKKGIRPIWEDAVNNKGGKWIVRLKKGVADRYWEDLLFAIVGDQFGEAGEEVCGVVLSVRNGEDILSIWTRAAGGKVLKIRETMKRVLSFPADTKVEWKSHDSSIQQRTAIEESRREKTNNHHHHHDKRGGGGGGQNKHGHQGDESKGSANT